MTGLMKLFDDAFFGMPRVYISENQNFGVIKQLEDGSGRTLVEAPGATEEDVDITCDSKTRVLTVEVKPTKNCATTRTFALYVDKRFDTDAIDATLENGLLELNFKPLQTAKEEKKKIKVTNGSGKT